MEETNRQVPTKGRNAGLGVVVFTVCAADMVLSSRAARISPLIDHPENSILAKIEAVSSNCNRAASPIRTVAPVTLDPYSVRLNSGTEMARLMRPNKVR